MKNRNIFAGLAAAAIVCAATVIPASAVVFKRTGNADYAPKTYTVSLSDVDAAKLDKVRAELKCDSGYVKGCIRYQDADSEWTTKTKELKDETGEWVFEGLEGQIGGEVQIEFWWVNPAFDAQGNPSIDGTATIERVVLLDAEDNELKAINEDTLPVVTAPPVTEPPATEPPVIQTTVTTTPERLEPVTTPAPVTNPPVTNPPTTNPIRAVGYGLNGNSVSQGISAANQIVQEVGENYGLSTTTAETGTDVTGDTTNTMQTAGYGSNPVTAEAVQPQGNVTTGDIGVSIAAAGLVAAGITAFAARKKRCIK